MIKLTPEQQSEVDRIQEMRREIVRVENTLPDPFDFYDGDNNFICKKDDFVKGSMCSRLVDGKIRYFIIAEGDEDNPTPAADVWGEKNRIQFPFWHWALDNDYLDLIRLGPRKNWDLGVGNGIYRYNKEAGTKFSVEDLAEVIAALMFDWLKNHKRK